MKVKGTRIGKDRHCDVHQSGTFEPCFTCHRSISTDTSTAVPTLSAELPSRAARMTQSRIVAGATRSRATRVKVGSFRAIALISVRSLPTRWGVLGIKTTFFFLFRAAAFL